MMEWIIAFALVFLIFPVSSIADTLKKMYEHNLKIAPVDTEDDTS